MAKKRGLVERLNAEGVVCAGGFLFEMERRGYLTAGHFVPEVVLDNPDALESLHKDFQHAGSTVVMPFTYYANREKLRLIGRENDLESMNRAAIRLAKKVSFQKKPHQEVDLVCGDICNTNVWSDTDKSLQKEVYSIFDEQVRWAADEDVDFVLGETYYYLGEALAALEVIHKYGLPAVINLAINDTDKTFDGFEYVDAAKRLEQAGAEVVGFNCFVGPYTIEKYTQELRKSVKCHVSAMPVPYRTEKHGKLSFFNLEDKLATVQSPHGRAFPTALDPFKTTRYEIRDWAERSYKNNVKFLGVCCGNAPVDTREVALAMNMHPEAEKYKEQMSKHFLYGNDDAIKGKHIQELGDKI